MGTYLSMLIARLLFILINCLNSGEGIIGGIAACFTIFILLPFLAIWTLVGTYWYAHIIYTHQEACVILTQLPKQEKSFVIVVWLAICYIVVVLFLAAVCVGMTSVLRDRRTRERIEAEQYLLEDRHNVGLTEEEIRDVINLFSVRNTEGIDETCSICIDSVENAEHVLKIPICEHLFHEECLEGWLRVKPICPNCKAGVRRHIV